MKKLSFILFLAAAVRAFALLPSGSGNVGGAFQFNPTPLATPAFGDSSKLVVGSFDASGNFQSLGVSAQQYFSSIVFGIDPNSFAVIGNTLYSKGLVNGGSYPSMVTNWTAAQFVSTNLVILGAIPSYYGASISGLTNTAGIDITHAGNASVVVSADGGATWKSNPTNAPCLVALSDMVGAMDSATNVTIYSYVNPAVLGQTNDTTDQILFVRTATDGRQPVTLSQANSIAASTPATWSQFPATSAVNFNGKAQVLDGTWTVTTSNGQLIWTANLVNVATITPGISSGSPPVTDSISVSGGNVTFQINASSAPSVYYVTNLTVTNYTIVPSQTNWQSGGFWFVSAPLPLTNNAVFFKSATAGTNTAAAVVAFNANVTGNFIFTNAAGAKFSLVVNSSTNGFNFVPQ